MPDDTSTAVITDDAATVTTVTTDAGDGDQQQDETPAEEQGLPDGARKALSAARKQAREAERARKALQSEVDGYKQRDMTEQQKLEARATTAEKAAEETARELNRLRAALAAGLDAEDADLITGTTAEDMKASAKRLAERFGATRTNFDGGARTPAAKPTDMNDLIRRQRSTR